MACSPSSYAISIGSYELDMFVLIGQKTWEYLETQISGQTSHRISLVKLSSPACVTVSTEKLQVLTRNLI